MEISAITWPLALIIIALILRQRSDEPVDAEATERLSKSLGFVVESLSSRQSQLENELIRVDAKFEGVEAQMETLGLDLLTHEENHSALTRCVGENTLLIDNLKKDLAQTTKAANAAALATGFDPSKVTYD